MSELIADIFVTIGGKQSLNRIEIIKRSFESFRKNTKPGTYRLTTCFDGISNVMVDAQQKQIPIAQVSAYQLMSARNEGLGPTINRAVDHICGINDWLAASPDEEDRNQVAPFIVMCQDDLYYTPEWLPKLAMRFFALEHQYKLGFASGIECPEHKILTDLGNGMQLKNWIRAAMMLGRREYWKSMMPIPPADPERGGKKRAKPNDGIGSGVDWHLIRNHLNSVDKTGRTCLVIPGLAVHAGFQDSTWFQGQLPESDSDKDFIENAGNLCLDFER